MKILMTNDDGYLSTSLKMLFDELKKQGHDIIAVAPSEEKSACAHSLSCNKVLKFIEVEKNFYKLDNGTPADCIHLALHKFYKNSRPDLVVSGINFGANVAEDITYSGTCGGAMEASLQGIKAIAISQFLKDKKDVDFSLAINLSLKIIKHLLNTNYPINKREFLNLNVPCTKEFKGLKVAPVGEKIYTIEPVASKNPNGEEYYWLGKNSFEYEKNKNINTDIDLLLNGFATLSPITLNLTANSSLKRLSKWIDFLE